MAKVAVMLPKPAKELKLAFIPTAGDPYGNDKSWMDADRAMLVGIGFQVEDFDLKNKTEAETRKTLSKFDVLFVAGGNTFYLLNEANKSGFTKVAKELVKKGTIYIGSSAGSYLACPTIEAADWKHADRNIVNITDWTALGLVDFIVIAHYSDKYKEAIERGKKTTKFKVEILTDSQFIKSDGKKFEIFDLETN
jgi:dipeptidase E